MRPSAPIPAQNAEAKTTESVKSQPQDHQINLAPPTFIKGDQPIHYTDIYLNRFNAEAIIEKCVGIWNKYAQEENTNLPKEEQLEILPRRFEQIIAENKYNLVHEKLITIFDPNTNKHTEAKNFFVFISDILDKYRPLSKQTISELRAKLEQLDEQTDKLATRIAERRGYNRFQLKKYLTESPDWQEYFACCQKADKNYDIQIGLDNCNQAINIYTKMLREFLN